MTHHIFPKRRQRIPANITPLFTSLLILTVFFTGVGLVSAYSTVASSLEIGPAGVPQESGAEQDASVQSLTLTADGSSVALTPAFDPDITRYYATVNASSVSVAASATRSTAGFTVAVTGGSTVMLTPVNNTLAVDVPLTEGQITDFSFTLRAPDGETTRTYHIAFGRPGSDSTPDVTIVADRSEYVPRQGNLAFTITRTGDTSDNLDVTINISQDRVWLSPSSFTTTIHAGGTQTTFTIGGTQFLPDVPAHGYLAATVAPIDGYDTSGAPAFVRIVSQEPVPTITIEANRSEYVAGLGKLEFTLTREGDPADSLDATVNFTQERSWLSDTSQTATFAAGDADASIVIPPGDFSSTATRSGNIKATVAPVNGYDVSNATATVRVISQEGPAVTLTLEHPTYTVDEDASTLDLVLVARAHTSVPYVGGFRVAVLSDAQTASSDPNAGDYGALSVESLFDNSDFQMGNGTLVARKTISVTIVDDDVYEGNEYFHIHLARASGVSSEVALLDSEGEACSSVCSNPYVVIIIDNESAPLNVGLANIHTGTLAKEDLGRDWFSFDAIANENYIIEVKHPMTFDKESNLYRQVPGYLVDPSILEVVGPDNTQILGERHHSGFTLNWDRAFLNTDDSGTYRIAAGAGREDRTGLGSYTISVRVDDHADDFRTDPDVVLRLGESITARIDSDVAPDDPDLEPGIWGGQGVEMLDDRDVFRFRIADAGEYMVSLSGQPFGVGIRYVWDGPLGNLWLDPGDVLVESFVGHYEPGTYYVEVGTPFESEGNTGTYTVTLAAAPGG